MSTDSSQSPNSDQQIDNPVIGSNRPKKKPTEFRAFVFVEGAKNVEKHIPLPNFDAWYPKTFLYGPPLYPFTCSNVPDNSGLTSYPFWGDNPNMLPEKLPPGFLQVHSYLAQQCSNRPDPPHPEDQSFPEEQEDDNDNKESYPLSIPLYPTDEYYYENARNFPDLVPMLYPDRQNYQENFYPSGEQFYDNETRVDRKPLYLRGPIYTDIPTFNRQQMGFGQPMMINPMHNPMPGPMVNPNAGPMMNPNAGPMMHPNAGPMMNPNVGPMMNPDADPMMNPNAGPMMNPNVGPMMNPNAGLMMNPNMGPMINPNAGPMMHPNAGPMMHPNAGPMMNPNADPMMNPMMNPNVGPMMNPMMNPNVGPMMNPNAERMINPMGDQRVNPNADPMMNQMVNPNMGPMMNPMLNQNAGPMMNPMGPGGMPYGAPMFNPGGPPIMGERFGAGDMMYPAPQMYPGGQMVPGQPFYPGQQMVYEEQGPHGQQVVYGDQMIQGNWIYPPPMDNNGPYFHREPLMVSPAPGHMYPEAQQANLCTQMQAIPENMRPETLGQSIQPIYETPQGYIPGNVGELVPRSAPASPVEPQQGKFLVSDEEMSYEEFLARYMPQELFNELFT